MRCCSDWRSNSVDSDQVTGPRSQPLSGPDGCNARPPIRTQHQRNVGVASEFLSAKTTQALRRKRERKKKLRWKRETFYRNWTMKTTYYHSSIFKLLKTFFFFLRKKLARFPTLALASSTRTAVTVSLWSCESFLSGHGFVGVWFFMQSPHSSGEITQELSGINQTCAVATDVYLFSSRSRTLTAKPQNNHSGTQRSG